MKEYDLTACQFGVLIKLFEEDCQSLSSIGKSVYCDKPTITGIVNRLEKKRLLKKVRDEKDRRVIKAVLTEKGRDLQGQLHEIALGVNKLATKEFDEEELAMFKGLLRSALDSVLGTIEGGVINVYG